MVFLLTKGPRYFYDATAIRQGNQRHKKHGLAMGQQNGAYVGQDSFDDSNAYTIGANARNVWTIPTQGRPEAHFATFPDELPRRCILAGTSEHGVCAECGGPWVRQVAKTVTHESGSGKAGNPPAGKHADGPQSISGSYDIRMGPTVQSETVGWQPTCNCNAADCPQHKPATKQDGHGPRHAGFNARWKESGGVQPKATDFQPTCTCDAKRVPATVLDPFIGSGTTIAVAQQIGRHGIGLDLNPDYLGHRRKAAGRYIPTHGYLIRRTKWPTT